MTTKQLRAALALVAITADDISAADIPAAAASAVRGGATMVQLRRKRAPDRELVELARALIDALSVPVLVNDSVAVALAAGAHGVHLGPDDLPPSRVRTLAPPGFIIGVSVGAAAEVSDALAGDYWGIGPWHPTSTKDDAGPALDRGLLGELAARADGRPWVAIGGVRPADLPAIRAAGAAGVAVVSGIFAAADIERAARAYRTPS